MIMTCLNSYFNKFTFYSVLCTALLWQRMPVVQLENVIFSQYQKRHLHVKIQPQLCGAGVFKFPYSRTTKVKWKNDSILIITLHHHHRHDLKVSDDGKLVQPLHSWTLSIVSSLSKMSSCIYFKTQCFRDWILSPPSGKTSVGSTRQS
jgi:hypothetical protein